MRVLIALVAALGLLAAAADAASSSTAQQPASSRRVVPRAHARAYSASEWEEEVAWECAVPLPRRGAAAQEEVAVSAAAVTEAASAMEAAGVTVQAAAGAQVSILASPRVAASSAVQDSCLYLVRSQAATARVGRRRLLQGGRPPVLGSQQGATAMRVPGSPSNPSNTVFTGKGVKVGILSDSFNAHGFGTSPCAAANQTTVLSDLNATSTTTDEGRAMAELVCFVAPDASIYFHTGKVGEAAFANSIIDMVDRGMDVLVDDMIYFAEAEYSLGVIAQAVEYAKAAGVAYFGAAGNQANNAWVDRGAWYNDTMLKRTLHSFAPSGGPPEPWLKVQFIGQFYLFLQWDEPFYRHTNGTRWPKSNIDLYVCPSKAFTSNCLVGNRINNVYPTATNSSNTTLDALERIDLPEAGGTYYVAIQLVDTRRNTLRTHRLKLIPWAGGPGKMIIFPGQNQSLGASRISPHVSNAGGMAVGAANYPQTPGFGQEMAVPAFYTSWGRTPIFLDAEGKRLNPPVRLYKPDVVGPDGTDTSFFGQGDPDSTGYPNFLGTSAAAPHVAAVAALMLEREPGLKPDDIYDRMRSTARSMIKPGETATYTRQTGYGFIAADTLLGATDPAGPAAAQSSAGPSGAAATASGDPDDGEGVGGEGGGGEDPSYD